MAARSQATETSASRTIVLTGCSRGLGRALLDHFLAAGHRVAACARSNEAIAELAARNPTSRFNSVDVRDDAAVAAWAAEVHATWGACDLLINNAALMNRPSPLWKQSAAEIAAVVDVNIVGMVNCIRHFVPAMVERRRGVIVNLSSGWGRSASAEVAPYCATKYAVEGLTQAMAQELPSGMAAVALNPGVIDTDMLRQCWSEAAASHIKPAAWAKRAAPYILALGPRDNGESLSAPS